MFRLTSRAALGFRGTSSGAPRLRVAALAATVVAFGCAPAADDVPATAGAAQIFSGEAGRWVDLTHSFSQSTTYWPTAEGFELDTVAFGQTDGGYFYSAFNFSAAEHGGTHLDAPVHFAEGRLAADEIPLERLIGPALVVDVSARVDVDAVYPDYQVTVADLEEWEAEHGRIADGGILLIRTGWGSRYGNREAYLGTSETGPDAVPQLHFPGLDPAAAVWLAESRSVDAVGIDTPSIDYGQSTGFESHVALYTANIPGFENVANLDALPAVGAYVMALPMKIEGGSGAPLRIVAWVPE